MLWETTVLVYAVSNNERMAVVEHDPRSFGRFSPFRLTCSEYNPDQTSEVAWRIVERRYFSRAGIAEAAADQYVTPEVTE